MAYPTPSELLAQAAEAGFRVGDYVHMATRDFHTAAPIREFSMSDGQLVAVWMNGACRTPLPALRHSAGHRPRSQFAAGYEYFLTPGLIAQVVRQAGGSTPGAPYSAVFVRGFGTGQVEAWGTSAARPEDPAAVFVRLAPAPILSAPDSELSTSVQMLVASQLITAADVAHQMKVPAKKASKLFKEMQELYGPQPTCMNLALFSGASNLMEMIKGVMEARKLLQGR